MKQPPARSPEIGRNARLGLWFFLLYCLFYAGFIIWVTFSFQTIGQSVAGLNWAVLYGMGLIVAAVVLAVVYAWLCSPANDHPEPNHHDTEARR